MEQTISKSIATHLECVSREVLALQASLDYKTQKTDSLSRDVAAVDARLKASREESLKAKEALSGFQSAVRQKYALVKEELRKVELVAGPRVDYSSLWKALDDLDLVVRGKL